MKNYVYIPMSKAIIMFKRKSYIQNNIVKKTYMKHIHYILYLKL